MQLSATAQRVLGVLIEKEMATPQSYPLSLNALTTGANQSTNREPVTAYTEAEVAEGIRELTGQGLLRAAYARRSSTPKYEHQLGEHLEIGPAELAVLAVLLLRGPQTVGELRQRTDRLHGFADLNEVQDVLNRLATHHFGELVEEAARRPGQKEVRWRHLLGPGSTEPGSTDAGTGRAGAERSDAAPGRLTSGVVDEDVSAGVAEGLAEEVTALRRRVDALEARLAALET